MTKMAQKQILMVAAVSCLALTGCGRMGETMPSMMNQNRAELVEQSVLDRQDLELVDEAYLNLLAEQAYKYGEGPVELTVTYDPTSKNFTAMKAINAAEGIADELNKKGLTNLTTQTLPVEGQKPALMVAFDTVGVQPPSSCGEIPGMYDYNTTGNLERYRIGCAIETNLARQIARPADLKGNDALEPRDGRTNTNVIDAHEAGAATRATEDLSIFGRSDVSE